MALYRRGEKLLPIGEGIIAVEDHVGIGGVFRHKRVKVPEVADVKVLVDKFLFWGWGGEGGGGGGSRRRGEGLEFQRRRKGGESESKQNPNTHQKPPPHFLSCMTRESRHPSSNNNPQASSGGIRARQQAQTAKTPWVCSQSVRSG